MTEWREDIEKEFGTEVYQTGFSGDIVKTGSFIVDLLTGVGGFPCGAIVEAFGTEGSGKTTLALTTLKGALEEARPVLFLDWESTITDQYLLKLDIDPTKFRDYRILPDSMEDGFMVMNRFCERYKNGLIINDSVAAMPPLSDVTKMKEIIGQVKVASQAQVMSVAMRQMVKVFRRSNTCVIFLNQERSNIDTLGRGLGRKTTPGGAAVKFYSALRIQMEIKPPPLKIQEIDPLTNKKVDQIVALVVEVRVIKNRLAPSYRRGRIVLRFDEGIDNVSSALWVAEHMGLIKKKGAFYALAEEFSGEIAGERKEHGFERVRKYFADNPDLRYKLMEKVNQFLLDQIKLKEI